MTKKRKKIKRKHLKQRAKVKIKNNKKWGVERSPFFYICFDY